MQTKIIKTIFDLDYLEPTTKPFVLHDNLPISKLIEYIVIKFLRQFECNRLLWGFENEWSSKYNCDKCDCFACTY